MKKLNQKQEDALKSSNKTKQWIEEWVNSVPPSPKEKSKSKQWIEGWIDTAPATNDEKSKVKQWLEDWVNDTSVSA